MLNIADQRGENVGGAENHFSSFVKVQISHRSNLIRELKLDLIQPNRIGQRVSVLVKLLLDDFAVKNMQEHDNPGLASFTVFQLSLKTFELRKFLKLIERHFFIFNGI